MGYLPTDVSFNLALLIDENRNYFLLSAHFSSGFSQAKSGSPVSIHQVEVHLDLESNVLKDKKIRDEDLMSKD